MPKGATALALGFTYFGSLPSRKFYFVIRKNDSQTNDTVICCG